MELGLDLFCSIRCTVNIELCYAGEKQLLLRVAVSSTAQMLLVVLFIFSIFQYDIFSLH